MSKITCSQTGTGEPSPENVRAIAGWDAVRVLRTGRNLLDASRWTSRTNSGITYVNNGDGSVTVTGTNTAAFVANHPIVISMPLCPGTYTVSGGSSTAEGCYIVVKYRLAGAQIYVYGNKTFEVDVEQTATIYLQVAAGATVDVTVWPMIEAGGSASAFEPYQGVELTAALPETVYGGMLDWTSGVLTVTHAKRVLTGTEAWQTYGNTSGANGYYAYQTKIDTQNVQNNGNTVTCMATHYPGVGYDVLYYGRMRGVYAGSINTSTAMLVIGEAYATVNEFKSYLAAQYEAGTPVEVVYQLAEPYTVQIDPQTLDMLKGNNAVWSDCGDTQLSYVVDTKEYIDTHKAAHAEDADTVKGVDIVSAVDNLADAIKCEVCDEMVVITDGAERLVDKLTSSISAIQSEDSAPSPDNVLPITGWDSITVHRTGENLVSLTDYTTTNGHAATVITEDVIDVVTPSGYDYGRLPVSIKGGVTYTLVIDWEVYGRDESATGETRASFRLNAIDIAQRSVTVVTNRMRRIVQVYKPEADADTFLQWNPNYGSAVPAASRSRVMLLVGEYTADTSPAFVPGDCVAVTAALPETVYGGWLDWVTGALTVTHGVVVLDGTEAWGSGDESLYYLIQGIPRAGISAVPPMCSHYPGADVYRTSQEGVQATPTKVWLRDRRFVADAAGLKAWFAEQAAAGTPVQIVYQLAEPYTVQITPQMMSTLRGMNYVWSNSGNTDITHIADTKMYIDKAIATLVAAIAGV